MTEYADLEIGIHRRDPEFYSVEFRYTPPNSEVEVRLDQSQQGRMQMHLNELRRLRSDPDSYRKLLTEKFFVDPIVKGAFLHAMSDAQKEKVPLRVRLMIGVTAPQLHSLAWEELMDPMYGNLLSTSENILFSRYLSSMDWRPVRLRPKGMLRALIVVANPNNLFEYPNFAPIDLHGELTRAKEGLGYNIPFTCLPSDPDGAKDPSDRASLKNIINCLRGGKYEILYLVCHGQSADGGTFLWLEDDSGKVDHVSGQDLLMRMREISEPPQLIVLASCETAGNGVGDALASLGPSLAEAGIPAVLAMQGKISLETIAKFMPVLFEELQNDGQIDRAVALARGSVRDRPDAWMPALFMRLKRGRFWYTPGFGDEQGDYKKWRSLITFIEGKKCTPILGPGLVEPLIGSRREIALNWAKQHNYPLAHYDRESLPRVAQYILRTESDAYLPEALSKVVRKEISERFPEVLTNDLKRDGLWDDRQVLKALQLASERRWPDPEENPHQVLAQLKLPIYITTSPGDLLTDALIARGAKPQIRICPWNDSIDMKKILYDGIPSTEEPLVYHLFGHMSEPASLVFAEDQYFDYLIGVTRNKDHIPAEVSAALTNRALLFVGFHIDDWDLRVFFRVLMAQEGRTQLSRFSHAAAQIAPEEGRLLDVAAARNYLVEYFGGEKISIYWGSSDDFLKALRIHLNSA